MSTRELIEKCRDALAEELGAWDIDPPLFHVKEAHDACVAWLAAAPAAPAPVPLTDEQLGTIWRKHCGGVPGESTFAAMRAAIEASKGGGND
jgi:hypothetical protein